MLGRGAAQGVAGRLPPRTPLRHEERTHPAGVPHQRRPNYPLANIALVFVLKGAFDREVGFDAVIMFAAAVIQAYALGSWDFEGRPHPILGNLIGPVIFSALSVTLLGERILSEPDHLGYWAYLRAVFGLLRGARLRVGGWASEAMVVLEIMARASIVLMMYCTFEVYIDRSYLPPRRVFCQTTATFIFPS